MTTTNAWRRVSAVETQSLLATKPGLRIYDVRDPTSYAAGTIGAAQHLTEADLERVLFGTPKAEPVLIYCYHGNASQTYAQTFRDFGFKEIYDLIDGYEAWRILPPSAAAPVGDVPEALRGWLIEHGFADGDVNGTRENRMTPLMHASRLGDDAVVAALLEAGANLDALNIDGNNALWLACYGENPVVLGALIERGVAIDHKNDNGSTALMYAASAGKTAVVRQLLAAGADARLKNLDDFTALDMAANEECLRMLRAATR